MLIQKITKFPPDYNGNDNLMTNTLDKVLDFGGKALTAILGNKADMKELHQQSAQVYCSESGPESRVECAAESGWYQRLIWCYAMAKGESPTE